MLQNRIFVSTNSSYGMPHSAVGCLLRSFTAHGLPVICSQLQLESDASVWHSVNKEGRYEAASAAHDGVRGAGRLGLPATPTITKPMIAMRAHVMWTYAADAAETHTDLSATWHIRCLMIAAATRHCALASVLRRL